MIWCAFNNGNDSILFGCVYRPPHSCREVNLGILRAINRASELCDEKKYSALLIAGDFNHADINWNDQSGSYSSKNRPSSIEMVDCLNDNLLSQHVDKPTFTANVLDYLIIIIIIIKIP